MYCEIDQRVVDSWGIQVLRFKLEVERHELLQVTHSHEFRASSREGGTRCSDATPEQQYDIARAAHHPRVGWLEGHDRRRPREQQLPGAR